MPAIQAGHVPYEWAIPADEPHGWGAKFLVEMSLLNPPEKLFS